MMSNAALLIMLKDHSGLEHGAMRGVMWVLYRGGINKVCWWIGVVFKRKGWENDRDVFDIIVKSMELACIEMGKTIYRVKKMELLERASFLDI